MPDTGPSKGSPKAGNSSSLRPVIILVALLCLGSTVLGVFLAERQNRERIDKLLGLSLANEARIFAATFEFYEAILYELRDRFSIEPQPTRLEFKRLADTILERAPEIEALAWIPVVAESKRLAFERQVRAEGFAGYTLTRRGGTGELEAAPSVIEHLPIHFIEPMAANRRALGYDLAFDALAATIARAKDGPRTVMSPIVELVERPGKALGMVSIKPVYDTLAEDSSYLPPRRPRGYIAVFYYLPTFVPHVLRPIPDTGLDLLIVNNAAVTNRLIAFRPAGSTNATVGGDSYPLGSFLKGHMQAITLTPGKSSWSLYLHASPEWIATRNSRSPWIIGFSGLALTGLILTLLAHASRRAGATEAEIDIRTAELRDANAQLQQQIHAQLQTESALRNTQSTLLAAQRLGATGSWEVDLAKGTLTWSEQVFRIFGRDPLLFSPTNAAFFEAVHEDDRAAVREASRNAIQAGQPYHVEHRIRLPDGSVRHLQEHAEIAADANGRPARMIGAVRDITEHRIAEASLEQERTMLRTIIDAIPDSIYVKDVAGHYILQNRANLDRHGLADASDGRGKTIFDLTSRELAEQYSKDDWAVIHTGQPLINREEPFVTKRGEYGVFLTTKIAFEDASGQVAGLVGISRDVTQLKRLDEERQEFERHLNDAARLESLGVLAGGIAHDFNNLLTGVLGNASLLRTTYPTTPDASEAIAEIEAAAEKAAELCRQMLAYAGKGRFVIHQFDLNQLIRDTITLLRHSVSKKAGLVFNLDTEPLRVEGDETQLGQIVMNLVINASEALAENAGTITITTGTQHASREYLSEPYLPRDLQAGLYAYVDVQDTGIGMSEEMKSHIFEPFFTTKFAGRGLGLAAALGIVRSHQGALKVTSTPGHGSSFRLLLPVKTQIHPPPPSVTTEISSQAPPVCRVLLVDDEISVRTVTIKMLKALHCSATDASDGEAGLAKFLARPDEFELILLDLTMPRLNGHQVSAEIWKLRPKLPIIFMSGYNEEDAAAIQPKGMEAPPQGPKAFLQKPFTVRDLSAKMQAVLAAQKRAES